MSNGRPLSPAGSFLGTGWGFPPRFTAGGADVDMVSGAEDIHQSLQILLATQQGERPMQERYGCDLNSLLFEEVDQGLVNRVHSLISSAILYHEPRIKLLGLDVSQSPAEPGLLLIRLDYRVLGTNSRYNMVYPFYLNEAVFPVFDVLHNISTKVRAMTDYILLEGDIANFLPSFGAAVVVVQPADLVGSGPATFNGTKLCVDGDERDVAVQGCTYMTPQYSIPGTGTLKIDALAADQKASKTSTGGTAVLLKGSSFMAKFEVQSPAQQPPPGPGSPVPDPTPQYSGSGMFVTFNTKLRGT